MKKTILSIAGLCTVIVFAVISCQKDYNNHNETPPVGLNELFAELRTTPQIFAVNVGTESTIVGTEGTVINFHPNSFKDAAGNVITGGIVNIKLEEMYTPGDMIRNRATTTTADGEVLTSGGEINLKATMNGQEVFSNGYGVKFKQPAASSAPMFLYYGNTNNDDSLPIWTMADTSANTERRSSAHRKGQWANGTKCDSEGCLYVFDTCTKFRNINCDRFGSVPNAQKTTISVVLPDKSFVVNRIPGRNMVQVNTEVYLIFPSINGMMKLGANYWGNKQLDTLTSDKVPMGWAYKIAVVTHKGGLYYFYKTSGTVPNNKFVLPVNMEVVTAEYIKQQLKGL